MEIVVTFFKPMTYAPGWSAMVHFPGRPGVLIRGRKFEGYATLEKAQRAARRLMKTT